MEATGPGGGGKEGGRGRHCPIWLDAGPKQNGAGPRKGDSSSISKLTPSLQQKISGREVGGAGDGGCASEKGACEGKWFSRDRIDKAALRLQMVAYWLLGYARGWNTSRGATVTWAPKPHEAEDGRGWQLLAEAGGPATSPCWIRIRVRQGPRDGLTSTASLAHSRYLRIGAGLRSQLLWLLLCIVA